MCEEIDHSERAVVEKMGEFSSYLLSSCQGP